MNLEFQPKFNSTKDGLTAASGMKSSSMELKGLKKGSICFKDLLSQTKNGKDQQVYSPQNTLPNEKSTEVEIDGSNKVSLKEVSLSELFPEMDNEEKSEEKFPEITKDGLMSLLHSSQNLLLTTINDVRISINLIPGSQDLNQSAADINGKQNFESFATTGKSLETSGAAGQLDIKEFMTSTKSSEPILGEMTESLLVSTETDQKTKGAAGQIDIKELVKSPESAEPIPGEMAEPQLVTTETGQNAKVSEGQFDIKELVESSESIPLEMAASLLAKTEMDQETMAAEDESGLINIGINEIPLMANTTLKNPEIQAIEHVELSAQIEQEIVYQLNQNKPITFQMRLDPENLGEIDIQLKFDQGKLIIDIMAFSKETQALLLGQIDKLINGLALQNVQVESVHLNSQSQNSNASDNKAFMMNMGMDFTQDQKQSLSKENLRDQHNFSKETSPDNDQDLVMGIEENEQRLKNRNYKINVLV